MGVGGRVRARGRRAVVAAPARWAAHAAQHAAALLCLGDLGRYREMQGDIGRSREI